MGLVLAGNRDMRDSYAGDLIEEKRAGKRTYWFDNKSSVYTINVVLWGVLLGFLIIDLISWFSL